jgi:microsomal dipeptidase-like Zn-dependent dipeptidase
MEIAEGLARSNLSDVDIGGILGANWMRIASQVWK